VREVVCGHVFDEGACELVVANAAVDPAQEDDELHQRREGERPGVRFEEFEKLGHGVTGRNQARRRCENIFSRGRAPTDEIANANRTLLLLCGKHLQSSQR